MSIIIVLLMVLIVILVLLSWFLFWHYQKLNKQLDMILGNADAKDLRQVILNQVEKSKELEIKLQESQERIKVLEATTKTTFQKMGVIRFNPYKELGGDQSFVLALLDGKDDGLVISSFFSNTKTAVYAKQITGGKSKNLLSKEEEEAIKKAMKND